MNAKLPHLVVLVLLLGGLALPAAAQSTTSGSLLGTISDSAGGVLPGVTVTVSADVLVAGESVAVTDERGNYRFPSLPPGLYTVQVQLSGFKTVRQENVKISVGQPFRVDLTLDLAAMAEEITVIAETPQVSTVSNAVATTLTPEFLEKLPLSRSVNALINYTPTVSGMRAYGATQRQANSYSLDGVDVSDPGSGDYWLLPSIDWLQEVQVSGLGADAEYGGFTGAVFNLVTKSGGNTVQGDVSLYYSGGDLVSENTPAGVGDDVQPTKKDSDWDLSVSVGGALQRDRLWYFVSGEEVRIDETPFQPAEYAAFQEHRNTETELSRYLGKLTLQANPGNRVVALLDYDGKFQERRGIDYNTLDSASQKQESPNWSYNLSWETLVNESNFVTAKLTGFSGRDDRLPYNGDTPGHDDADTGLEWGNYRYTWKYEPRRINLDLAWNLFADGLLGGNDSHTFKFGAVYARGSHEETRTRNGSFTYYDDSYYCDSLADYLADPACGVYSSDLGNEIFLDASHRETSLYAQDALRFDRVTVNLGARYTRYQAGFDATRDDVYEADMVAPRIGFVWDATGDGRTAVKAHYGRYYEGMFTYMFDREENAGAFTPYSYCDYDFDTGGFDNPDYCGLLSTNSAALDPDISHPYVDQVMASIERQVGRDMAIGLDLVYRENKDMITFTNLATDYDPLVAPGNPLTGGGLPFYDLLEPPAYMLMNQSEAYREYQMATLRFEKRYSKGWLMRASLVWADLEGNTFAQDSYTSEWDDKNGQTNAEGKLPGYSEWEFKLSAAVDLPWGIQASGYYTFMSGEYWTPTVEIRGLYENNRAVVFMDERGSEQLDDRQLVDLRLAKEFAIGSGLSLTFMVDAFNVFNSDTVTDLYTSWGRFYYDYPDPPDEGGWDGPRSGYQDPLAFERPREIRFGARLSF